MTRSRYTIKETALPHFLTCTVVNWLPLFSDRANAQILLDSLAWLQQENRMRLYGYVIMENHIHLVAGGDELSGALASFKSFTARRLIDRLKEQGAEDRLKQLVFYKEAHKRDREHQVWQEGSHPQAIQGEEMMRQKLDYLHYNPVRRGYVDTPEHWRYSSARDYAGATGLLPVTTTW